MSFPPRRLAAALAAALLLAGGAAPCLAADEAEAAPRPRLDVDLDAPNWTRAQALAEAQADPGEVAALLQRAATGEGQTLVWDLERLAHDTERSAPAREAALLRFAEGLQALPAGTVSRVVTGWLRAWPAETLVPHPDHPRLGVPLLPVAAAAAGAEHAWARQSAAFEAAALMALDPAALVAAFETERDPNAHRGYLQALDAAPASVRAEVLRAGLERLPEAPALAEPLGRLALDRGDLDALARAVAEGRGVGVTRTLRLARRHLAATDAEHVLRRALTEAPAETAALALAELAVGDDGVPRFEPLLLDTLAHPGAGAAAALLLARSEGEATWTTIDALAAGAGEAAPRARLAQRLAGRAPADPPP